MVKIDLWEDYKILDVANGYKLEKWGDVILERPDPQIRNQSKYFSDLWSQSFAKYVKFHSMEGYWEKKKEIPETWNVKYKELVFNIKPMTFKHTGLFPEQAINWDWIIEKIQNAKRPVKVLNLFAYTGGATVASLYAGASVCHVDSSKSMINWAKENVKLSNLEEKEVRYIVDDVKKFVKREIKRGNKYDAIIMDPPSYGRGKKGEIWKFENDIDELVSDCSAIMSDNPIFFLINSYTTGIDTFFLKELLSKNVKEKFGGSIDCQNIGLAIENKIDLLPCGMYGRWEK